MAVPSSAESRDGAEIAQLSRIDLNLLVHLQVLLEERSVTRTAARIGLTQPAMSHSLNRCRRLLGDDLLTRVSTALELTPRGRALLGPLTRLLRELTTEVLDRPGFVPATSRRRFRFSASSTTSVVVLAPLLRRLAEQAPGSPCRWSPVLRSPKISRLTPTSISCCCPTCSACSQRRARCQAGCGSMTPPPLDGPDGLDALKRAFDLAHKQHRTGTR